MKKPIICIAVILLALLMVSGCPSPLISGLASDIVITLGRFNPTANNTLYAAPGGTLDIPVTITDQTGRALTGSYTVTFTLSADADLATTGDNEALGTATVTAGGEQVVSITVPAEVAAAVYTLFAAISDAGDTVTGNNTAVFDTVQIGAAAQPNLQITSLATVNTTGWYAPGAAGKLSYTITNNGFTKLDAGTTIALAFTINLSGVDTPVGTATVTLAEALYPADFVTGTADFTMPAAAALAADNVPVETAETFTEWGENLTAEVDPDNAIAETNEADNTATVAVSSASAKPELAVTGVALPADTDYAAEGEALEYTVTIENSGYAAASGYTVTLFVDIDDDGTNNTGDKVLYTWATPPTVPFDAAGGGNNTAVLTVPAGEVYPAVTAGTYYVRAAITGLTEEWDDTNNVSGNGQSPEVDFIDNPIDLELVSMNTTLSGAVVRADGASIPLSLSLRNNGSLPVETDFVIHFYANNDGTLNTGTDLDLETTTVTDTVPGKGSIIVNKAVSFPAGEAVGFYTIYWVLDSTAVVTEYDEANNEPASANGCFVFFPVTDGATDIDARLLVYKPRLAPAEETYLRGTFYEDGWGSSSSGSGYPDQPGELAFQIQNRTLTPGNTIGIEYYGSNYADYPNGAVPYAFRLVPQYVSAVPPAALPAVLGAQDGFEDNDSQDTAALLTGMNNPLTAFVNAYTTYAGWNYDNDYYYFVMP